MKLDLTRLTALQAEHDKRFRPLARKSGEWYNIVPGNTDTTTVYMYGEIGGWDGVTSSQFVSELSRINSANIDLHVNSIGGSIFEGVAIMSAIAAHPAYVTGIVDGVAASAASFILMACDKIKVTPAATLMIHDGQGITVGDEADHLDAAAILGKLSDTIADIYARRAGGTMEEWRERMRVTTFYNATEAIAAGLADETTEDVPDEPAMRMVYDLSVFRATTPKPMPAPEPPPAPPVGESGSEQPPSLAPPEPVSASDTPIVNEFDVRTFRMALLAAGLTGA